MSFFFSKVFPIFGKNYRKICHKQDFHKIDFYYNHNSKSDVTRHLTILPNINSQQRLKKMTTFEMNIKYSKYFVLSDAILNNYK